MSVYPWILLSREHTDTILLLCWGQSPRLILLLTPPLSALSTTAPPLPLFTNAKKDISVRQATLKASPVEAKEIVLLVPNTVTVQLP
jgi:hypothetical protein